MVSKSPFDGLSGGSDFSHDVSNSNGNGKGQKQKAEKTEIPIYKYTARFKKPLHEAILLSGEPFFLAYDPEKKFIGCIRNIEESKRILRPPDDSEYPYEPIEFESLSEIKEYTELALHETIDSLFQRAKAAVTLYVDQEHEIVILIAADTIWTWFQDLFPTTHYYDVNGKANGIGKSTIGHVFEGIGYRGVRMTDPSSANLFRVLGQIEPGQCIIIADEADRIHKDRDALSILKEGYGKFGKVPKINTNTLKQEFFYCYCFKIRIAEDPLRGDITKGVIDRSFQIKAIKGYPAHDIKEVLDPATRIERLKKLHNDLTHFKKLMLCYRLIHYGDRIADIDIEGLEGRDKELCKPLLQLFYGSKAYDEVKSTVSTFLERKNRRKRSTAIEPVLFEIVVDMIESRNDTMLLINDIWEMIRTKISGVYIDSKPNEYQTYDYDTIYRNVTSKVLEGFGAEHERTHEGRLLIFNPKLLLKTSRQYDIPKYVQDKLNRIQGVTAKHPVQAAVTPSRGLKDENIIKSGTDSTTNNVNIQSNEGKSDENVGRDGVTATRKPLRTSVAAVTAADTNTRISNSETLIYQITPKTNRWGCKACHMEGERWELQAHRCSGNPRMTKTESRSKSKLADIAEANESGAELPDKGGAELR